MRNDTVEGRFQIEPSVSGRFEWQREQLWFIPEPALQSGEQYTVRLKEGALSQNGRRIQVEQAWSFSVRQPYLIYFSPASGKRDLWRSSIDGREVQQLTQSEALIWDYAVSKDGSQIVYSLGNEDQGIDFWILNRERTGGRLLLDCDYDRCTHPAWSPDGRQIMFPNINAPDSNPRLQLGVANAQTEILIWLKESSEVKLLAEDAASPKWLP